MSLPKAILFDADGTLYDSEPLNYESNRRTARELHNFDFTWEMFDTHVRRGPHTSPGTLRLHGVEVDDATYVAAKLVHFESLVHEKLQLMPGLRPFLQWCQAQNIYCGIVSMSRLVHLDVSLKVMEIGQYFSDIISVEDVDDRAKPDPFPYLLGLERAGVTASEAIAVEDTAKGIASAVGAGITTYGLKNDYNTAADLLAAKGIITSYDELLNELSKT